jgi:alpha-glucosidase
VPGPAEGAEPLPGGGTVRFARSELHIMVTVGGAVFRGWDGARPEPSYALAGAPPEPDPRAGLEPDKDGGWQVVSERLTVAVSRHGAVEIRTPGGVVLRRDLPPRWWEPVEGGPARWVQRSEIAADARLFGLGGRASGPRLRDGSYRLWNTAPRAGSGPGDDPLHITMPVQTVVADAGCHLAFHDNTWDGRVIVREGQEGAGSGHDRPGTVEVRMEGGPLRSWVLVGTPARVLGGWAQLTGAPALPPSWALGPQHVRPGGEEDVRRAVDAHRERGLPLSAVHVGGGVHGAQSGPAADLEGFPRLSVLAKDLREDGVRLVRAVGPAVSAGPEDVLYGQGSAAGLFVREAGGAEVRGTAGRATACSRISRIRGCVSGGESCPGGCPRRASPVCGWTGTSRCPVRRSPVRRSPVRHGTCWRAAAATTGRPTTSTGWPWRGPRTRGCAGRFPTSGRFLSPGPAGWACRGTGVPGRGM